MLITCPVRLALLLHAVRRTPLPPELVTAALALLDGRHERMRS